MKNRHNCVKAQRTMQHRYHIGADLVGTIENEYIRNDTNTKLCPVMQMAVCDIIKALIECGGEVKLENKINYARQVLGKLV